MDVPAVTMTLTAYVPVADKVTLFESNRKLPSDDVDKEEGEVDEGASVCHVNVYGGSPLFTVAVSNTLPL